MAKSNAQRSQEHKERRRQQESTATKAARLQKERDCKAKSRKKRVAMPSAHPQSTQKKPSALVAVAAASPLMSPGGGHLLLTSQATILRLVASNQRERAEIANLQGQEIAFLNRIHSTHNHLLGIGLPDPRNILEDIDQVPSEEEDAQSVGVAELVVHTVPTDWKIAPVAAAVDPPAVFGTALPTSDGLQQPRFKVPPELKIPFAAAPAVGPVVALFGTAAPKSGGLQQPQFKVPPELKISPAAPSGECFNSGVAPGAPPAFMFGPPQLNFGQAPVFDFGADWAASEAPTVILRPTEADAPTISLRKKRKLDDNGQQAKSKSARAQF
jgi:hypothetical protein